jgi:hypothetical protein
MAIAPISNRDYRSEHHDEPSTSQFGRVTTVELASITPPTIDG